jgi:hypothetical protein
MILKTGLYSGGIDRDGDGDVVVSPVLLGSGQ